MSGLHIAYDFFILHLQIVAEGFIPLLGVVNSYKLRKDSVYYIE